MAYDGNGAANYVESRANPHSKSECAKYVREAVEWGGIILTRTRYAKDYGGSLEEAGFYSITGAPRRGDAVVIQPAPGMHTDIWRFTADRSGFPISGNVTA